MSRHVNAVAGRLSLRPPQRQSLEILERIMTIAPPGKAVDLAAALDVIRSEFPSVSDFEREFVSVCFALATGVGKTRLMGAFISYLHAAHGIDNFFVLAPNLTIYNKLIADFTPNTPKYVFAGIAEFATQPPAIINGENYEALAPTLFDSLVRCKVNIFNISKINTEVRGGRSPRIKRLSEYIGQSYFDYLAGLPDLVLLMDESHRYRASAGVRAINELKPILGLELTATPFVEGARTTEPFKNVIYSYPLGRAIEDGYVKEPAVVTRKDFDPKGMSGEEIERLKLEDGIRLHESVKVELETYARETGNRIVKPFVLVIARDTTHAAALIELIGSVTFFDGRYADKVIQVDSSSRSAAAEEEMVTRLLKVEDPAEPTEIVVHVNMLKEGWDVTNLYTIVPLRAANARTLVEQSIGRGLRLPYGRRAGVSAVDRLNIVAHDRFQEIVDDANQPDSPVKVQLVELSADALEQAVHTVVSVPTVTARLGLEVPRIPGASISAGPRDEPLFQAPEDRKVAELALNAIRKLETRPDLAPTIYSLKDAGVLLGLENDVRANYVPAQIELEGVSPAPDIAAIVSQVVGVVVNGTIAIPRVQIQPKGEVRFAYKPFALDLSRVRFAPVAEDLWVQHLRTGEREILSLARTGVESRPEDYVVSGLIDYDDVSYDDHADLLYDLAGQVVRHFQSYLPEDEVAKVLRVHQREIAHHVYAQMQVPEHYREEVAGYEPVVSRGFTELRPSAFTAAAADGVRDFRVAPPDIGRIGSYLFGGFERSLYALAKFHSDTERQLAVLLDRDAERWFRPVKGQFQIFYRLGTGHHEYVPDFVAEGSEALYLIESKARNQLDHPEVIAKSDAAVAWCRLASDHAADHHGKAWCHLVVPHDAVAANITLRGLVERFARPVGS